MKDRLLAIIAVFTVQLLYGINYTFVKEVINGGFIKPSGFVLLRLLCTTIMFWLLGFFMPKQKIERKDFVSFLLAAFFGVFTNMIFFFKGLEYTTPIHASAIMTTTPIVILVLSTFILKEKWTIMKISGVSLGLLGALILSIYGKSLRVADNIPLGNIMILTNAVSYSIYVIIIKKLTDKYHPFTFMKWLFLFGSIFCIPFGYQELREVSFANFTPYAIYATVFVIVGATFLTYLLNPLALTKLKASTVGIFIYLQPVVATIFALSIGADFLDGIKIIAIFLIFFGVYLVTAKPKFFKAKS